MIEEKHLIRNEKGFTFYTHLFIFTVLLICIPIQGALILSMPQRSYYEELSIQQFFLYIQQDINAANNYNITSEKISLTLHTGELVTFEAYGKLIRRRVNNQGHEIYLRNINDFDVTNKTNGFIITIESTLGEVYEKEFVFYP